MENILKPDFERQLIEDRRDDGYWIEAFKIDSDGKPHSRRQASMLFLEYF